MADEILPLKNCPVQGNLIYRYNGFLYHILIFRGKNEWHEILKDIT